MVQCARAMCISCSPLFRKRVLLPSQALHADRFIRYYMSTIQGNHVRTVVYLAVSDHFYSRCMLQCDAGVSLHEHCKHVVVERQLL